MDLCLFISLRGEVYLDANCTYTLYSACILKLFNSWLFITLSSNASGVTRHTFFQATNLVLSSLYRSVQPRFPIVFFSLHPPVLELSFFIYVQFVSLPVLEATIRNLYFDWTRFRKNSIAFLKGSELHQHTWRPKHREESMGPSQMYPCTLGRFISTNVAKPAPTDRYMTPSNSPCFYFGKF